MIKKYFITGLVILLPLTLTILIVLFIFNLLTEPFLGAVKAVFDHYDLFERGFTFVKAEQLQTFIAQLLILLFLCLFTVGLGMITRWFFFRSVIKFAEYIVKHIPLVNSIYKTCKEVIKTVFTSKNKSFKQVVMVRFPNPDTYAIGLVTRDDMINFGGTDYEDIVSVFVPTTPNPTSGFLVLFKREDLVFLDMKVEDAFKYIISCGLISSPFRVTENEKYTMPAATFLKE
jgi:uncharacterized membrane protein